MLTDCWAGAESTLAAKCGRGATPAHYAAGATELQCLEVLLAAAPATAVAVDADRRTPLHYAALAGDPMRASRCVQLLHRAGARVDSRDAKGRAAVHMAAAAGDTAVIQELHAAGAVSASTFLTAVPRHFTAFHCLSPPFTAFYCL